MLTFNVNLPIEELYCPSLSCDCYDYVFMGLSQPLIGTFSIPIGALKTKAEKKRVEDLTITDEILNFLMGQISKSQEALHQEASVARSKSQLSDQAQQRMTNKLKNQANKMRKAASKGKAANAFQAIGAEASTRN